MGEYVLSDAYDDNGAPVCPKCKVQVRLELEGIEPPPCPDCRAQPYGEGEPCG